jgi:hypothetical protein
MIKLSVVSLVVAAVGVGGYPPQHQGSGREPTRGSGVFAGTPFVPHTALADYEIGLSCCPSKTVGNVNVFLFERAGVTCGSLEAARSNRFFSYTLETDGERLPVGRLVPAGLFQQASFNIVGLTTGFQPGVSIVFTRIDTSASGVWHGRIRVPRQVFKHKRYGLTASSAARWCGSKRT